MKPLVIYHANCADGFGAAFTAWTVFGDEAEYLPLSYMDTKEKSDGELLEEFSTKMVAGAAIAARDVYILDFSLPRQVMDWIFDISPKVVWLDHHKTAFEMWGCMSPYYPSCPDPKDNIIRLDNNKSGAMLAWEYFHPCEQITNYQEERPYAIHFNGYADDDLPPGFMRAEFLYSEKRAEELARDMDLNALYNHKPVIGQMKIYEARLAPPGYGEQFSEVPMFIKHIDDYDRWQFKIEGTKAFNKALWSYAPWSFEQWWGFFSHDCILERPDFYTEGNAILRAHNQNVQSVVKSSAREVWIKALKPIDLPGSFIDGITRGWQGLSANCPPHLTSDVGHELATQSGTFGLCWTLSQTGFVAKCSLRSNGEYDVSAIAKAFGGGGHRNAAGFEVDMQTLLGWLK